MKEVLTINAMGCNYGYGRITLSEFEGKLRLFADDGGDGGVIYMEKKKDIIKMIAFLEKILKDI